MTNTKKYPLPSYLKKNEENDKTEYSSLPNYLQPQKQTPAKKNVTYGQYDWDYEGYKKERENYKKPAPSLSSLPAKKESKKTAPIPSYLQQVSKGDKQLNLDTLTKSKAPNWQKALLSPLAAVGSLGNWVNADLQKDNGKTTGSKFLGRTLDQARSAYTGGAVIRTTNKGNATAPMETGSRIGNLGGDLLGMGLGFSANNSFLGTSQGNALNKAIGQPVGNALTKGASKLGLNGSLSKIGIAGLKTGTEFGGLNAMSSIAQGKNTKETLKNVGEGFVSGALFGAGGKTLGELGKGLKSLPKATELKQNAFNSKFGKLKDIKQVKSIPIKLETEPFKGKFTVKNTAQIKAQQEYDNAIETIQNHFMTNKLVPEEVARIKPELGIDLERLTNNLNNKTDIRKIADRKRLGIVAGVDNIKYKELQQPSFNKLPKPITNDINKPLKPTTGNLNLLDRNIPKAKKLMPGKGLSPKNDMNGIDVKGNSKFIENSIQNSAVAPKVMKDTVGHQPYIKINNKDTWNKAVEAVENDHQTALKNYFNSKELKSADDTALGQALIVKAIKEGRINNANELSVDLAEKLSKAGQTVQAASIFKRLSPEGMLQYANNVVNRANQVIEKESGKSLKGSIKKINLSTEEVNKILEGMKEYLKMPEGSAKDIKIAQIMQIINNKQPSTLVDKIRAVRNISLLGNLKTNARNVVGNTIMGVTDNVANTIGAPLDKLISLKTGQRAVGLPNLGIQAKGFVKGTKGAIQDSFGGIMLKDLKGKPLKEKNNILLEGFTNPINRDLNSSGKFETGNRLAFENKPMRVAENLVGTSLKIGDQSFKTAYYDDVLNQLMKTNKVTEATQEMKAIAQKIAEERTYQDNNNLTKFAMGIKNLPQRLEGKAAKEGTQIFVDSQLPYVKTPANLLKRASEYTPVGLADGVGKLNKGLKNNTLDMASQRKAVDRITRGTVGTGLMGLGALGIKNKFLTGSANKDKDIAALDMQTGKQPYAIKLPGGKYYSYDWAQPISMPISAGGQMVQGKKGQLVNNALEATSNALTFYSEQPMLQSIQNLVGSKYDNKPIGQRVLEAGLQLPKQFVPTLLKQVNKTKDDNVRSTYSPNFLEKNLINPIKAGIPGLSSKLPIKYDTLGREIKQFQGNNNFFNVAVNPGNLTTDKSTPVEKELIRLYNDSGETIQAPVVAPTSISKSSTNPQVDLTGEEVSEYQRLIGINTLAAYNVTMSSDEYKSKTDAEKAKMLSDAMSKAKEYAKINILKKKGVYWGLK